MAQTCNNQENFAQPIENSAQNLQKILHKTAATQILHNQNFLEQPKKFKFPTILMTMEGDYYHDH